MAPAPREHSYQGETGIGSDASQRAEAARRLYRQIGAFLSEQRLAPNPVNYAFAYHVLTNPRSSLAIAVAARTDGGVRLTQRDIDELGAQVDRSAADAREDPDGEAQKLVAQTQFQVESFADMMEAMQAQTHDFGRDLVASAEALEQSRAEVGRGISFLDDIARVTSTMVERIEDAERRLAQAQREAQELRRKLEKARGDALSDPLTGLPNRRAFENAYAAAAEKGQSLCVAICDVDHFKTVNDRFGHAVGDRVLRAIGETLTQSCEGHLVARFGGEEFALLFHARLDDARETLATARRTIADKRYRLRESDAPLGSITFSAGLTCAEPGEPLSQALRRADRMLYAAKAAGRNTILSDGDISA